MSAPADCCRQRRDTTRAGCYEYDSNTMPKEAAREARAVEIIKITIKEMYLRMRWDMERFILF